MSLIEWRDEFATGIKSVDHEHQQLIEMINSIYSMLKNDSAREDIVHCLGDIYAKISGHFMLEERLMQKYDYDQYQIHTDDHRQLLDDIGKITDDVESTSALDAEHLQQKLNEWFQIHFKTHDARLHHLQELIENGTQDKNIIKKFFNSLKS